MKTTTSFVPENLQVVRQLILLPRTTTSAFEPSSGTVESSTPVVVAVTDSNDTIGQQSLAVATYVYTDGSTAYPAYYPYQQQSLHSSPQQTTYIVQQQGQQHQSQASPNSIDDDGSGAHLSHTTRASPATIQWLVNNYETAEGTSLPRCTLYDHYIKHCEDHKLDPVNAASFGKLIRSVFLGLKTRRLGTRGNSKYHYYGIRIKPDSILNRVQQQSDRFTTRLHSPQSTTQHHHMTRTATRRTSAIVSTQQRSTSTVISEHRAVRDQQQHSPGSNYNHPHPHQHLQEEENCGSAPGDGRVPACMPDIDGLAGLIRPLGLSNQQVLRFANGYHRNCEDVLECVKRLKFGHVGEYWRNFWQPENENEDGNADGEDSDVVESESGLSQMQLFSLVTIPHIQRFILDMDLAFYQVIIDVLIPDVLSPTMTGPLTMQIRNFAKSLEAMLTQAMQGAPDVIMKKKMLAVRTLGHTLRRYTSLNHLAQAARNVLQQPTQILQMHADFNKVDIVNVQEQAGWVCGCDTALVNRLQTSFKVNLEQQKSLEQWTEWMEAVVDQVLAKYHDRPLEELTEASKRFLLKWSFYSSMVIRDLTLRSAQSFGSFHLIRLLYDEFMLYLVEQRLSKAANKPALAIMTPGGQLGNSDLLRNSSVHEAPVMLQFVDTENTIHVMDNNNGTGHKKMPTTPIELKENTSEEKKAMALDR